ncbi:hypothetical protein ABIF38_006500 [Bradyrhizobium japonicum]|jgi:hypothetical protein|uniref:Uncharacterized protein n=1 Tax=Bradyrhizobium elkanii TaxID=29448 RepID=A0ABV4F146_BRAEL|nr:MULTISPECIES: hypothetical protein [Bradyrhizobium]MBP2426580.1 hypothetical protein [Bradyrhizobium elkanii]MCP1731192.1 hypothetical protein [Bradyrhizobium elkanii]MCP1758175.1 hypothetical protein [Bradyrhizobium elkanii]MCP1931748.1 hypothetical protein [Bradyrhizobium elkanii]MCP1969725.1 hypothetical protein [Bradyrhizobium elkanii]
MFDRDSISAIVSRRVQLMNLIDRYFFAATITVTIVLWLYLGLLVAGS